MSGGHSVADEEVGAVADDLPGAQAEADLAHRVLWSSSAGRELEGAAAASPQRWEPVLPFELDDRAVEEVGVGDGRRRQTATLFAVERVVADRAYEFQATAGVAQYLAGE